MVCLFCWGIIRPCRLIRSLSVYQYVNTKPASGDKTIIITEKLKDSIDVSVARCSDGNIF